MRNLVIAEGERIGDEREESQDQFRILFELAPVGIAMTALDGRFLRVNQAFAASLGYSADQLLDNFYIDIARADDQDAAILGVKTSDLGGGVPEALEEFSRHDSTKTAVTREMICRTRTGGEEKRLLVSYVIVPPDLVVIYTQERTSAGLDGSERKKSEEQLRHAQRMEAIGQLAGGVAHDFNNLLTAILGYSDILLSQLGPGSAPGKEVENIKRASERAASLTRHLLAFSRSQLLQPEVLDLNEVVADTVELLGRLLGEEIEPVAALDPKLGRVKADPGQVGQVLVNLAVNARDAMPEGGRLTIRTANADLREAEPAEGGTIPAGRYVRLTVTDTGSGIETETLSHIFEPFFTTKEKGKGTGLGLSTVYGIATQSGGYIRASSQPGAGTTFDIFLPRISDETQAGGEQAPSETIMVVEDEPLLLNLAVTVLEEQGYAVLRASNGEEALRLAAQHGDRTIHLLVTDVVMPQMSGHQLAKQLEALRPDMRTLYVSGYTTDTIAKTCELDGKAAFLQKPFSLVAFAAKVRAVLDVGT